MKSFANVSIRVLSLYFAVRFLGMLGSLMTYAVSYTGIEFGMHQESIFGIGMTLGINVVLCILLWRFSEPIAVKIVGASKDDKVPVQIKLGYEDAMKICIKMTGLIIIVMAIPEVLSGAMDITVLNMNKYDIRQSFVLLLRFLTPFLKIMIGTVLLSSERVHYVLSK